MNPKKNYCKVDYRRWKRGRPKTGPSRTYVSWRGMKQRCLNPNNVRYRNYGGRGVTVCQRWLDSYDNFFEDMGHRPEGMTLDKDILGDGTIYSPETCMWATPEQQNNAKRNVRLYSVCGRTDNIKRLAISLGLNPSTVNARINVYGYTVEEALAVPFVPKQPSSRRKSGLGFYFDRGRFYASFANNGITKRLGGFGCPLLARLAYVDEYQKVLGCQPPQYDFSDIPRFNR